MLAFEIATHRNAWVVRGARVYMYNHRYMYIGNVKECLKRLQIIYGVYTVIGPKI